MGGSSAAKRVMILFRDKLFATKTPGAWSLEERIMWYNASWLPNPIWPTSQCSGFSFLWVPIRAVRSLKKKTGRKYVPWCE